MKKVTILLLLLIFCNQSYSIDYNTGSRIVERLDRLEKDLVSLHRQLYRGTKSLSPDTNPKNPPTNIASVDARIANLEEKFRTLTGQIEQLNHSHEKIIQRLAQVQDDYELLISNSKASNAQTKITDESSPTLKKAAKEPNSEEQEESKVGKIKITAKNSEQEATNPPVKKVTLDPAQSLYEQSFANLRAGKYSAAATGFNEFIKKYKDHKLLGNAYYWLGETYFIKKDYKNSGANFLRSYNKNPNGNKAYEALLKLATSFSYLDKKKEACSVLNKLDNISSKFPNSLKQKIKAEEDRIECK
jgi:tol-pal system protein YbgF